MSKLNLGDVRITHAANDEVGSDEVVVVELDEQGALVSWPRAIGMFDALSLNTDRHVPEPLVLRDGKGWLTLCEGHSLGASASSLGHSEERIRYSRAVATGSKHRDYATVNGMTSEIDGLAKWAKLTPVKQELLIEEGAPHPGIVITAKNIDPVELGGALGLRLLTSYNHHPDPRDGRYSIETALLVRSRSESLRPWAEHRVSHQMIQDLMSLVYGKPCLSRLQSVMREDDQEREPTDERRYWREAYEPGFGRQIENVTALDPKATPLFYLDEAGEKMVAAWLEKPEVWGRATWIAVTALFHHNLPAESRLIQVAVALEALGYAVSKENLPGKKPPFPFVSKVKRIFDDLGFAPTAVTGNLGANEWSEAFNEAYNGVKHADNELTTPFAAWEFAEQGLLLFRAWIASKLGVDSALIEERLK